MQENFSMTGEKTRLIGELMAALKAGRRPLGMSTAMNSPIPLEIASRFGYQWSIVDQEHTLLGSDRMVDLIRASEWARCVTIVKINAPDPVMVRDALDAGACGIQMPGTNNVKLLKEALNSMKYELRGGTRGICPVQRSMFYHTNKYSGHSDWEEVEMNFADQAILMPTVETPEGMRNLEEMLKIDECPIWHIGPMDLASSLGLRHEDPAMADVLLRTVRQLAAKIHKAGKFVCYPLIPAPVAAQTGKGDVLGQMINGIGVDMPYTVDSSCMGYGMAAMVASRDASIADREPTS